MSIRNCDIPLFFKWNIEVGRLSWIIWVVPKCNHMYFHKKEAKGDLTQAEENKAT